MDEYRGLLQEIGILTADDEFTVTHRHGAFDYIELSDELIASLWRVAFALREKCIGNDHIRAFVYGRSAYLRDSIPLVLLADREEDIAFEAAMAWATSETPDEFLEEHPDFV